MNEKVPIRPAATIALLYDAPGGPEVFLVRRHAGHVFAASAYVYPGGAVEAADSDARLLARYDADSADQARAALDVDDALAYWAAASRECFEEAGVLVGCSARRPLHPEALAAARDELNAGVLDWLELVERMDLRFDAADLHYFAHWTTPPGMARRFSTRFFAARMPDRQHAVADGSETTRGEWLQPAVALDRYSAGDIVLMPPTLATLRRLSGYDDIDGALADLPARPVVPR